MAINTSSLRSMTGFGRGFLKTDHYKLIVLIKSTNSKNLDIRINLPKELLIYEKDIRDSIKKFVYRGNIVVSIFAEVFKVNLNFGLDELGQIVDKIVLTSKKIGLKLSDDMVLSLALKFYHPEPAEEVKFESEEFKEFLMGTLEMALKDFLKSKIEEGQLIREDLERNINLLESLINKTQAVAPQLVEKQKQKLISKAKELLLPNGEKNPLLLQEIKFLLEKTDINEEIQRLKGQIEIFKREMNKGTSPIGKKLEFITQEMMREANTLGNKLPDLYPIVIEIKSTIDKLRQQVANVE
jgi:uncharacterized protein (TIGR00255 family)